MSTQRGSRSASRRVARGIAAGVAAVVAAGFLTTHSSPRQALEASAPAVGGADRVVGGKTLPVKPRKFDSAGKRVKKARWPKASVAAVELPAAGAGKASMVRAGGSPVWLGRPAAKRPKDSAEPAAKVRVRVLSRADARAAGVDGVVFTLASADRSARGSVRVRLDYHGFGQAFGGDYGNRLRLVQLPACALTTPRNAECRTMRPVDSARNNRKAKRLYAEVEAPAAGSVDALVLAAQAADSSDKGDYKASSLSPSAEWQVSDQSGDFGWSFPLRVPPTPGGLAPAAAIGYSSGSVDGRTSNTNNQPSWIGEGFELSPGFIERHYKPCADDGAPTDEWGNKPGDQCWAYDNATVTWNGKGGELIKTADGSWRMKNDDGTKFEKFSSTARGNGDDGGEYWRVTTTEGVRYYFGYNRLPGWVDGKPETKSAWTVPVFGDDAGEPCNGGSFASSWCDQAYRWNLDYVVDPHGNAMAYYYNQETNYYGRNLKPSDATKYVRGGWLDRTEYGLRSADMFAKAPARVVFTDSERCLPDGTFDCDPAKIDANTDKWPDVPWDLNCNAGAECGLNGKGAVSPTFWTRKRLTKITTQVQDSVGDYRNVDSWSLAHRWGDADLDRALLLTSIQHTGLAGPTSVALPPVTFTYIQLPNRLDKAGDDIPPFIKYRVGSISDEFGGKIDINHSQPECVLSDLPIPETNTKRCFPVYWTPAGRDDPIRDWFHKYVVNQVIQTDRTGGAPDMITEYEYLDGAAWHYDTDDGITKEKHKTWSQWRGYGRVQVRTGGFSDGMLTQRETLYLRGMNGDRASPSGGTKTVEVSDGEGGIHLDDEAWAGFELKTMLYDRPGGTVLEKTVNTPWKEETAKRTRSWGTTTANLTGAKVAHTWTQLSDSTWRETETINTFEPTAGLITRVDDRGDLATATDDLCTRTTYAQDPNTWKLNFASEVETVSISCGVTNPDRGTQLVSHTLNYFDGGALGAPPGAGDITTTKEIDTHDGITASYVTTATTTYDSFGRVTSVTDAGKYTTTTAYTDTNGLNTTVTLTSPPTVAGDPTTSLVMVTAVDPAFGQAVSKTDPNNFTTQLQYDALGRLRKVWLPNRATSQSPNLEYSYQVTDGAIVAVGIKEINAQGGQKKEAFQLFDGWLRPRQTQVPGPSGGRLIADTFYDSRGNTSRVYNTYYAAGAATPTLFGAYDGNVETQTAYTHDGLNRVTAERLLVGNGDTQEKWRTAYSHSGDRTHMTPPAGGTPTTTIVNARGQTVELRQYKTATPSGDYVSTKYTYTPAGKLATITDHNQNVWRYTYDLRGRRIKQEDPDTKAPASYTYDDRGLLISTQDARNKTIFRKYDALAREIETREGSPTGPLLTSRVYDTVRKGQLTSTTRYVNDQPYTTRVNIYDNLYRPIRTTVTIPAVEGALAGSYQYNTTYRLDGLVQSTGFPAAGDMTAEALVHTYDPDDLGRLIKLGGYVTNTIYSHTGKLQQLELSTGGPKTWITNSYEYGTQRLASSRVDRENIAGVDRNANYKYDDAGNITSISDVSRSGTDTQCFTYDRLRRLTEAWTQGTTDCVASPGAAVIGGPAPYWHTYGYDDLGNRTDETIHGVGGTGDTVRDYIHPAKGQAQPHTLASVTQTGAAGARTDSFTYDDAGNTIQRVIGNKTQTLAWDSEGHVAKVTEDGRETSFVYDADGNRLIRRDPSGTTLYLPNMELRLDNDSTTAKATRYYTYLGQNIAIRTSSGVHFLAGDHNGTSQLAVNATDQTLTQRRYSPFGQERSSARTWIGDKGFVGGTNDKSTGLTNLGARQYDPATGRFISIDPIINPNDPQQMHGYAYANNSPITFADPSGLIPEGGTTSSGKQIIDENYSRRSWINKQVNLRHRAAVLAAYKRIRDQVAARGGNPDMVKIEYAIPNACKSHVKCGNSGNADIVYIDQETDTIYVWEVKSGANPEYAKRAGTEVQRYMSALKAAKKFAHVKAGWKLGAPIHAEVPGSDEKMVVYDGEDPGEIYYKVYRDREPEGAKRKGKAAADRVPRKDPGAVKPDIVGDIVVGVVVGLAVVGIGLLVIATAPVSVPVIAGAILYKSMFDLAA